jgi:hypothetical protein
MINPREPKCRATAPKDSRQAPRMAALVSEALGTAHGDQWTLPAASPTFRNVSLRATTKPAEALAKYKVRRAVRRCANATGLRPRVLMHFSGAPYIPSSERLKIGGTDSAMIFLVYQSLR